MSAEFEKVQLTGKVPLVPQEAHAQPAVTPPDAPLNLTVALVANPLIPSSDLSLPYQISAGIEFDRATQAEIRRFKELFSELLNPFLEAQALECYESHRAPVEGNPDAWGATPLPPDQWRYHVVRSEASNMDNIDIQYSSSVSEIELDLLTVYFNGNHSYGWSAYLLLKKFDLGSFVTAKSITARDLDEIGGIFDAKKSVAGRIGMPGPYPEIQRAFEMLNALDHLPRGTSFQVLGLFAIIEMLITHNPKLEDRGDSITHQMKSKIPLLSKRFSTPLPYALHFGDASHQTVWSSLYAYRSSVAHGGQPDFSRGNLAVLRTTANADGFLKATVKSLIRHAVVEPQLYKDLREC